MSPITRAKKVKQEEEKREDFSRINALSQRLKNLASFNEFTDFTHQSASVRRRVRSQYSVIRTIIDEKRDEIGAAESNKFNIVLTGVDNLYRNVKRPREQVSDAEALLGLTNTVVESLALRSHYSISPSMFISSLLKAYGLQKGRSKNATKKLIFAKSQKAVNWEKIGADASVVFMEGKGCKTMLGVLKTEFKPRKLVVYSGDQKPNVYDSYPNTIAIYRKTPPRKVYLTRSKLVDVVTAEDKPDVNKNMSTISDLLKEKKCVMLDELLFRRTSFAHTVENLFALSFLVHNGEAAISADETGSRFLCEIVPRSSACFEVARHQFILRYDYNDWKSMQGLVPEGEDLMSNRAVSGFKP
ncbi:non-structural maintenance of chromosomes element 4 homolog B-like [Nicotiana sylvestris]|uniref:Non-structural maintenance of chromosomes element 4 n=1 Tax=Nicotiana sylvestris TaxID=4096 RepID=A0A1U7WS18_NICSY|nr:PREDICTED: non-structural maintenance of chromosomes element 4 homolog B-like [Nicotiana sylvestris]